MTGHCPLKDRFFEALQLVALPLRILISLFFDYRNSQRMPADVTEALVEIFMKEGAMDATTAEEFLKTLERTRHFQSETWAQ